MNDLENFNRIKANKLCCKCKSKNTCLHNDCSAKHHTNISHQIKVIEIGKGERKILNKIQTSKWKKTRFSHLQA